MPKNANWVIAAIKVGGVIGQMDATRLFKFLKKWDGDKPVFGVASAYELDGYPCFSNPMKQRSKPPLFRN